MLLHTDDGMIHATLEDDYSHKELWQVPIVTSQPTSSLTFLLQQVPHSVSMLIYTPDCYPSLRTHAYCLGNVVAFSCEAFQDDTLLFVIMEPAHKPDFIRCIGYESSIMRLQHQYDILITYLYKTESKLWGIAIDTLLFTSEYSLEHTELNPSTFDGQVNGHLITGQTFSHLVMFRRGCHAVLYKLLEKNIPFFITTKDRGFVLQLIHLGNMCNWLHKGEEPLGQVYISPSNLRCVRYFSNSYKPKFLDPSYVIEPYISIIDDQPTTWKETDRWAITQIPSFIDHHVSLIDVVKI